MSVRSRVLIPACAIVALSIGAGCSRSEGEAATGPDMAAKRCTPDGMPCTDPSAGGKAVGKAGKVIWAESRLYFDAPPLDVQTWIKDKPELAGKFVLVEFWRTWCGACKKTVPLLNSFQEKYGKELVVVGITGESEEAVRAYAGPAMNYPLAIDKPGTRTAEEGAVKDQGAIEEQFGVWGWPHVVLLEPEHRCVVWEGFPLLAGHELTAEKIEQALAVHRKRKAEGAK